MTDKRENVFGLTPFPERGGYIEYVWDELSYAMRDILLQVKEVGEARLMWTKVPTLNALIKRGLVASRFDGTVDNYYLTEDGNALMEWMKNKERNA
jgi:hypothetical protein